MYFDVPNVPGWLEDRHLLEIVKYLGFRRHLPDVSLVNGRSQLGGMVVYDRVSAGWSDLRCLKVRA